MSLLSEKFRHFRNKYINALILVLKIEKKKKDVDLLTVGDVVHSLGRFRKGLRLSGPW